MLQGTKRRLAMLERSIELPLTAERVLALVEERVRLTGASRNDVIDAMAASMTSEKRHRVIDVLVLKAFKGNVEAAATTLLKVMIDPNAPASVRVRAADSVLNHASKAIEIEDIEDVVRRALDVLGDQDVGARLADSDQPWQVKLAAYRDAPVGEIDVRDRGFAHSDMDEWDDLLHLRKQRR
jgi:hypothetical protein